MAKRTAFQDARQARTQNRKTFTTNFFPVGEDIEAIVRNWVCFLTDEKRLGPDDPLFSSTEIDLNAEKHFAPIGLARTHWKNADAVRRIVHEAFEAAGRPYYNPHSFRKTLALLGERVCKTPEGFKVWSQNLEHDQMLTTFTSYGAVSSHWQAEISGSFVIQEAMLARRVCPTPQQSSGCSIISGKGYG